MELSSKTDSKYVDSKVRASFIMFFKDLTFLRNNKNFSIKFNSLNFYQTGKIFFIFGLSIEMNLWNTKNGIFLEVLELRFQILYLLYLRLYSIFFK